MKNQTEKFLEFNGKTIYFLAKDGTWWIAIKPICEALNIEYTRQFKNAKADEIFGPALAVQPMQVGEDQVRNYACLPERYVYGWLCSIKSSSEELIAYKKECYDILYDHFHGTITNRQNLLKQKAQAKIKKDKLLKEYQNSPEFKALMEAEREFNSATEGLKSLDREIVSEQMPIWSQGV